MPTHTYSPYKSPDMSHDMVVSPLLSLSLSQASGIECPAHFYCAGGQSDKVPCPAEPGSFCGAATGTAAGSPCPPGSWCAGGAGAPVKCSAAPGFACQGGDVAADGTICPQGALRVSLIQAVWGRRVICAVLFVLPFCARSCPTATIVAPTTRPVHLHSSSTSRDLLRGPRPSANPLHVGWGIVLSGIAPADLLELHKSTVTDIINPTTVKTFSSLTLILLLAVN